jgi:alpha-1,6-mannosyltransferase
MRYPKTLHLTNFYHAKSGGIGAFYRALFQYANRQGRQMLLVVPGEESRCEQAGPYARIYYVKAPRSPWFDRRYRLIFPMGFAATETMRIVRTEQPDVIEISDKYTLPYLSGMMRKGLINGVKRPTEIATSHERMDDNISAHVTGSDVGLWFARFYMRHIYFPMFDHHIANSRYTAEELVAASYGHTTRRGIWTCPMGLDVSQFKSGDATPHRGKRLLYAGRISREKNVTLLIDMLERLPEEYSLMVAGDGPLRTWFLAEASRRCPGRIDTQGHFPDRAAFVQMFRGADAFIHPNPHEPFGITPLEAMASGLPVVAPNAGGVLSYANPDNCWLCDPNPDAFAQGVCAVFSNRSERGRRVELGRKTAEQHDWGVIAKRYFELIDSLHCDGFHIATAPLGAALDAWEAAHKSDEHEAGTDLAGRRAG